MNGETIQQIIGAEMPDFIMKPEQITDERERTMRLTMKAVVRGLLGYIGSKIIQNGAPIALPTPELAERQGLDALSYGVLYIIDRGIELLARQPWTFSSELAYDDAGPVIRVLGLAARAPSLDEAAKAEATSDSGTLRAGDGSEQRASDVSPDASGH